MPVNGLLVLGGVMHRGPLVSREFACGKMRVVSSRFEKRLMHLPLVKHTTVLFEARRRYCSRNYSPRHHQR